jgi:hypothetical protein
MKHMMLLMFLSALFERERQERNQILLNNKIQKTAKQD